MIDNDILRFKIWSSQEPESAVMDELDRTSSVDVMYVAEMDPPTADGAQVYDIGDDVIPDTQLTDVKIDPITKTKTHKFTFKKLDPNVEKYSCKIRTLVNGYTIVYVSIFQCFFFVKLIWILIE